VGVPPPVTGLSWLPIMAKVPKCIGEMRLLLMEIRIQSGSSVLKSMGSNKPSGDTYSLESGASVL